MCVQRYMPCTGMKARVKVSVVRHRKHTQVAIKDNAAFTSKLVESLRANDV